MAYPIALAGLALAAVGTGLQVAGQQQANRKVDRAQAAEIARQRGFQEKSRQAFAESLSQSGADTAEKQLAEGEQRRRDEYARLIPVAGATGQRNTEIKEPAGGGNPASDRDAAIRASTNNAWANLVSGAQAKLGGYGDWGLRQRIKNIRAGQEQAIIGDLSRGSASVLPYEVTEASRSGDALKGWGSLVGALGSVVGAYGAVTPATEGGTVAAMNNSIANTPQPNAWGDLVLNPEIAATA